MNVEIECLHSRYSAYAHLKRVAGVQHLSPTPSLTIAHFHEHFTLQFNVPLVILLQQRRRLEGVETVVEL